MNLHEYQSKRLFADYGIPVPRGIAAESPVKAVEAAKELGGDRAQIGDGDGDALESSALDQLLGVDGPSEAHTDRVQVSVILVERDE